MREIRDPEEGPYTRSKRVWADGREWHDTKKTAFVNAPETLRMSTSFGEICAVHQTRTCNLRRISRSWEANVSFL